VNLLQMYSVFLRHNFRETFGKLYFIMYRTVMFVVFYSSGHCNRRVGPKPTNTREPWSYTRERRKNTVLVVQARGHSQSPVRSLKTEEANSTPKSKTPVCHFTLTIQETTRHIIDSAETSLLL